KGAADFSSGHVAFSPQPIAQCRSAQGQEGWITPADVPDSQALRRPWEVGLTHRRAGASHPSQPRGILSVLISFKVDAELVTRRPNTSWRHFGELRADSSRPKSRMPVDPPDC